MVLMKAQLFFNDLSSDTRHTEIKQKKNIKKQLYKRYFIQKKVQIFFLQILCWR